jgi:hypothetical protein
LAAHGIDATETTVTGAPVAPTIGDPPPLRAWLQERINVIGQNEAAAAMLRSHWPTDVPTLKSSDAHTPEQIAAIELVLDGVERAFDLGFPEQKPV